MRPRSGTLDSVGGVLLAARGLPPDLLAQASHRLERLAFGLGCFLVSAFVLDNLLAQLGVYVFPHLELLGPS